MILPRYVYGFPAPPATSCDLKTVRMFSHGRHGLIVL